MIAPLPTSLPLPALQGPVLSLPLANGTLPAVGFQDLLSQSWTDTVRQTEHAQQAVEGSLIGDDLSMIETFTSLREADLSLKLMLQIRNKLVDAYQELQQLRF